MLVALLNVPKTEAEWSIWSFAHKTSHELISAAIMQQGGTVLNEYQLDPISPNDQEGWLVRNQQAHNDMNGALGVQSSDLQEADLSDDRLRQAWVYSHFLEHQTAEQRLGV